MIIYEKKVIRLTPAQAGVMKILRSGGTLRATVGIKNKMRYRVLDAAYNPLHYVHGKTLKALLRKQVIIKKESYYATPHRQTNR